MALTAMHTINVAVIRSNFWLLFVCAALWFIDPPKAVHQGWNSQKNGRPSP